MREVIVIAVGDSGSGKSSFGNLYLQKVCFDVSDSADPCTRNPIFHSNEIDNMIRKYFDTEGHCDGNSVNSQQIQKLALYLRDKNPLVNGVVIVLNGQNPRFSQGVKDLIKFSYTSFGGKDVLGHICVVFTRVYSVLPNNPNRMKLKNEYKEKIMNYISEISGISQIPDVPIFFADCDDPEGNETKNNLTQFHGWAVSRNPIRLNPDNFRGPDDIIEEKRDFHAGYETRDNIKYKIIQKQKRNKIIPNNGEPIRYSEWVTYQTLKDPFEKYQKETRSVDGGYIYSGNYRYKEIRKEERINTINLKTNAVSNGNWSVINTIKQEAGCKKCGKEVKIITLEKVQGRHDRSFYKLWLDPHTHCKVYEVTYKEERQFEIDFDGVKHYLSDWRIVSGSRDTRFLRNETREGHINDYERKIGESEIKTEMS